MKYTKGKWTVSVPEIEAQRLIINCELPEEDGKRFQRSICRTFGYCDMEEEQNNANLISAAPDLYETLKYVIRELDRADIIQANSVFMECASRALAKAEGKQE